MKPKQHKTKTNTTTASMYQLKCPNAFKAFNSDTCINTRNRFHVLQDYGKKMF